MPTLTRWRKLAFGSGDTAISLFGTTIDAWFLFFLLTVAKVPPAYAAAALFVAKTWDWVNDPLMGVISDRTRSRWGRRRVWLLFGAMPFGFAFALMWWIPPIADPRWLAAYYGLAYFLFDTGFTVIGVPFAALLPDVAATYDERTSVSSYRMAFSIAAGLLAFTAPDIARLPLFGGSPVGWLAVAGLFAVVCVASMWVVFAATGGGFDPDNRVPGARRGDAVRGLIRELTDWLARHRRIVAIASVYLACWIGVFGVLPRVWPGLGVSANWSDFILYAGFLIPAAVAITRTFSHNRPFLFAMVIFLLTWTTVAVVISVLPFFLTYWLRWGDGMTMAMAALFVSALVLVPFWNWFTRRAGKRVAYVTGMVSLAGILGLLSVLPSAVDHVLVLAIAALAGFGVSAAHVVPNSILPDGIEWEELRTGSRKEGFFFGVVSLLNKVANSVAVPWVALVLAATGYDEARGLEQPAGTLAAIRLLVGLVPGVLLALGVAAAAVYPLSRDRHERIRRLLELRKARTAGAAGGAGATSTPAAAGA
ncbi:MAG: MFS transporter, partial [Spirochaetes bacterium]|nr:MFS transporter [Spirochaetota bacterium]